MSGAFLGREVEIEIILGEDIRAKVDGAYPAPVATYIPLGGSRGYTLDKEWGSVDVTNRSSKGAVRESIADYLSLSGSIDGIWLPEDESNIEAADDYINAPPTGQPYAWIRTTRPGAAVGETVTEELYVMLTSFSFAAPYDDAGTFTMNYEGQQPVIKTYVAAP